MKNKDLILSQVEENLKRYLYSVLTVSNQFIPDMDLKATAGQFMKDIPQ